MPRRQLANLRIEDLEKLFDEKRENADVLTTLLGELSHRSTPRARKLKTRVTDRLALVSNDGASDTNLFILTPEQHRRVAKIYRTGGPDWTDEERQHAAKLAEHHEMVAKGIERRLSKDKDAAS